MSSTFFSLKRRAMRGLLAWGVASMAAGAATLLTRNAVIRHIGLQAFGWGAIDALLAANGLRDTAAAEQRGDQPAPIARRDRAILAVNTGLDIGYIVGGWQLVRRSQQRADRIGAGIGIMIQGFVLLLLDALLTMLFSNHTRDEIEGARHGE